MPRRKGERESEFKKSGLTFSEYMKKKWADPEYYARMKKIRKAQVTEEWLQYNSERLKEQWQDESWRTKMVRKRKHQAARPEELKRKRYTAQKLWANKDYRKKMMASRHKTMYGPEWRAKVSAGLKGRSVWNKGLTKHDHPSLMKESLRQRGFIPDYNKYRCWYPNDNEKKIRMRSSWEVGYALYLDAQGTTWEYEPKAFDLAENEPMYIPDFYLPKLKLYVEIKGWCSYTNRQRLESFKNTYPKLTLQVLTKTELREMGIIDAHNKVIKKAA